MAAASEALIDQRVLYAFGHRDAIEETWILASQENPLQPERLFVVQVVEVLHSQPPGLDRGKSCTRRASAAATRITSGKFDPFPHRNSRTRTSRQAAFIRHLAMLPGSLDSARSAAVVCSDAATMRLCSTAATAWLLAVSALRSTRSGYNSNHPRSVNAQRTPRIGLLLTPPPQFKLSKGTVSMLR